MLPRWWRLKQLFAALVVELDIIHWRVKIQIARAIWHVLYPLYHRMGGVIERWIDEGRAANNEFAISLNLVAIPDEFETGHLDRWDYDHTER